MSDSVVKIRADELADLMAERHRYYAALETLRDLRSSHDGHPLVGNLQAREIIDNALKSRTTSR